jgi:hypothetical protein
MSIINVDDVAAGCLRDLVELLRLAEQSGYAESASGLNLSGRPLYVQNGILMSEGCDGSAGGCCSEQVDLDELYELAGRLCDRSDYPATALVQKMVNILAHHVESLKRARPILDV